jgi:hypothetical protein
VPDSDLIGIPVVLGTLLAVVAVVAAFFFIGPVVGLIVLFVFLVFGGWSLIRLIGANEND